MKPTPKQYKEAVDRHDRIVQHLIEEGYADNKEMAGNIIMGMSEQWYNLIIFWHNNIIYPLYALLNTKNNNQPT